VRHWIDHLSFSARLALLIAILACVLWLEFR
jgi:hypothetical protein